MGCARLDTGTQSLKLTRPAIFSICPVADSTDTADLAEAKDECDNAPESTELTDSDVMLCGRSGIGTAATCCASASASVCVCVCVCQS